MYFVLLVVEGSTSTARVSSRVSNSQNYLKYVLFGPTYLIFFWNNKNWIKLSILSSMYRTICKQYNLNYLQTTNKLLAVSDLAAWARFGTLWSSSRDVCSSSMSWCFPILLRMLHHCIWDPWGAFGHILKEWMAFTSFSLGQMAPKWRPGPSLALWSSS